MTRFQRLEVTQSILDTGLVPLFYNDELSTAVELAAACARGGARVVEFTARGEGAYAVFSDLVRYFTKADPSIVLGVGSVTDAPTAALYLAAGANFLVSPDLNPEIARLCNRRKVLYIPGCATETEIASAEELGAEICKIFPGDAVGGPKFIRAVMAPCPWHRLLPTGGVDASEADVAAWIQAGAAALGMGSKLVTAALAAAHDYDGLAFRVADCIGWIQKARGTPPFMGIEHIGLYPRQTDAKTLSDWYADAFGFETREGGSSFFLSGTGPGRVEVMKASQDVPLHVAVRVSNFEGAVASLRAKGIGVKDPFLKPESKSAYLDTTDPDGNLVHLLWFAGK
jgi:2-dehydro-3-deoxyphosphogluconate aldolase/(4S)-4-hydroxy-2-oxoglutarate aldolase